MPLEICIHLTICSRGQTTNLLSTTTITTIMTTITTTYLWHELDHEDRMKKIDAKVETTSMIG